jgi:MoxR-like ATPase
MTTLKPIPNPNWFVFDPNQDQQTSKQKLQRILDDGPPPWRNFANKERRTRYEHQLSQKEMKVINAAIYLRRPLIVTGEPGTGKSSLAYTINKKLGLDDKDVLVWSVTSRSTLKDALYDYDAIGRLQAANLAKNNQKEAPPIEPFLTLGPVGTALADSENLPRVLLIDEIDKSDLDLPNDLLHLLEEGTFEIPELSRVTQLDSSGEIQQSTFDIRTHNSSEPVSIDRGNVLCQHFPIVIITSNRERELPAPLLRRCLRLHIPRPDAAKLKSIVEAHFGDQLDGKKLPEQVTQFIDYIIEHQKSGNYIAPDQLMNAVHLMFQDGGAIDLEMSRLLKSPEDGEALITFVLDAISSFRLK